MYVGIPRHIIKNKFHWLMILIFVDKILFQVMTRTCETLHSRQPVGVCNITIYGFNPNGFFSSQVLRQNNPYNPYQSSI